MLDLGASVNVMPSSIYKSPNVGDLEPTGVIIQLVNRSITHPLGILEDVLVQINELIFPTNFYLLNIEDEPSSKGFTLILGRSFLMTANTKINVHARTFSWSLVITWCMAKVAASESSPPFTMQPPAIELKPLPKHLKYAYLGHDQKLTVIIANNFQFEQEERLLQVLKKHRKALVGL
ncbi:hypothetical protein CR513_42408, partial [Mucuna pruriens]